LRTPPPSSTAWLIPGAKIFMARTWGNVEKVHEDGGVTLIFQFGRHGFKSRIFLNASEVQAAIDRFDLRPRDGQT
jgi:hypothetical protein